MPMTPPPSGKMKYKLRFERRSSTPNSGGVVKSSWATITGAESISASVEPTLGSEAMIAGRIAGRATFDIWVRSSTLLRALTGTDRAVNVRTGEIYNISPPLDVTGRRQWLFFQAQSAGSAEGQG